ncbi:MAG TPA: hypothetical protein DHW82_07170 [Spirochaetia bacterium]|nr:MAG: hypothetical protein A2Y41_10990 [Spirochaetes bacterium GWB1_36_13]HCL56774.1 hypothetical protein [Spirochaetia bacterium]
MNLKKIFSFLCFQIDETQNNFSLKDYEEYRKKKLISLFTFIFSFYLLFYSFIDIFILNHVLFGIFLFTALIFGILNFIFFTKKMIQRETASNVIISFSFVIFSSRFYQGGIEASGIFWMFLFPILSFFLKGGKKGVFLTLLLFFTNLILYFCFQDENHLKYPLKYTIIAFSVYLLSAGFSFFYEYSLKQYFYLIEVKTAELVKSKKQTEDAREELLKTNQIKDKMFTVISHDLRGSLGSIKNFVSYLISDPSYAQEKLSDSLNLILLGCNTTYDLLNNLLEWAKMQINRVEYQPSDFLINDLIKDNFAQNQAASISKSISLVFENSQNFWVYADKNMTDLILRNLIMNALKFTPHGGSVKVEVQEKEEGVEVAVRDTGIGMSPEMIDKLTRNENCESHLGTDGEKGAGIGLSLSKECAEKNRSRLLIESEKGKGTRIFFLLKKSSYV